MQVLLLVLQSSPHATACVLVSLPLLSHCDARCSKLSYLHIYVWHPGGILFFHCFCEIRPEGGAVCAHYVLKPFLSCFF